MNKRVLLIYYTQSGQLGEIVNNFITPFLNTGVSVEVIRIKPKNDFDFPWTSERFFEAMPESVLGIPTELEPIRFKEGHYDLIIFAYQPWYLSPSIPTTSLFYNQDFNILLKNTPVLTIIGARNMWLNAQERVKVFLESAGAKHVGNIALIDKHQNQISAITIVYWQLTGKKNRMWGIFPNPGIANKDILQSEDYGEVVLDTLTKGDWNSLQKKLVDLKAVEVKSDIMFIEERAKRLFHIWANIIIKRKNRKLWLKIFKYYLAIALFLVAPIVLLINNIIFRPFLGKSIEKKKKYYLGLN